MNSGPVYYTGYEDDDEPSDVESQSSESSSDEIEKDFDSFLKHKASKSKSKEIKLADDFEAEMNKQLDTIINEQQDKYLNLKSIEAPAAQMEIEPKKEEIVYEEEEDTDSDEELRTGTRCTKKKKKFTNEELFYDPEMDDADENWVNKQRKTSKKLKSPIKKPTLEATEGKDAIDQIVYLGANSDAVLNCPCCMTNVCYDCQRHEKFKTQYRAMFVFNCKVNQEEQLKYPKDEFEKKKFNKKKSKLSKMIESVADIEITEENRDTYDLFRPVACLNCNTEIGVYEEKEEIYHFFNVLASHS